MSMTMTSVDVALLAAEIADVVDRVFSYLFIFLFIKWGGPNRLRGMVFEPIFIKIAGPNKMILRVKNRKKWIWFLNTIWHGRLSIKESIVQAAPQKNVEINGVFVPSTIIENLPIYSFEDNRASLQFTNCIWKIYNACVQ